MNIIAKLKAMQREIEALRARVDEMDVRLWVTGKDGRTFIELDDPLTAPIVDAEPIASATIAPPPKKRGRPPKAT